MSFGRVLGPLAVVIGLSVGACARPQLPTVTAADAAQASQRYPGVTLAALHTGRDLYIAHCASCHQAVEPARIAPGEWPEHIAEMRERADLTDDQALLVERYLVTISEREQLARR